MHRSFINALLVSVALTVPVSTPAVAGTAVMLVERDAALVGVNVDIPTDQALVVINRVGVRKTPLVPRSGLPDVWFSDHASLTVNVFGLELPAGGINDAGLAIQTVWSDAPPASGLTANGLLETLQWIQYALDGFTTVDEVAQSVRASRVLGKAPVQILVCQGDGRCGMFEWVDGTAVLRVADELPVAAITGLSYRESLDALNRTLGYGGAPVEPVGEGAGPRFARAARAVHGSRTGTVGIDVPSMFTILGDLSVTKATRWHLVYDLRALRVHVRTASRTDPWTVDLGAQETLCPTPQVVADLSGARAFELRPYAPSTDGGLASASAATFSVTARLDPEVWSKVAEYPATVSCDQPPAGDNP